MSPGNNQYLLMSGAGLVIAIFGYFKKARVAHLSKIGVRVDGVVFSMEQDSKINFGSQTSSTTWYPVIRFVTAEKEWVTQRYNIYAFPGKYREGDKVSVVYNPDKITEFIIDDDTGMFINYFVWIGILLIVAGIAVFILRN